MNKKKSSSGFLLWSVVFVALLLLTDQVLLRVPLAAPGIKEIQVFYRDFRQRLLALPQTAEKAEQPLPALPSVARPSARKPSSAPARAAAPPVPAHDEAAPPAAATPPASRYVYADEEGNLQFAASLDEVPAKLRREAKRLE